MERTLGRIEGAQEQIIGKLDKLAEDFGEHKQEDQRNFSSIRALMDRKLDEQNQERERHWLAQSAKLDELTAQANRARGAIWVILGMSGIGASVVAAAVIKWFF